MLSSSSVEAAEVASWDEVGLGRVDSSAKRNVSSEADFDVPAKLRQERLDRRSVAEAFARGKIDGHGDLLDVCFAEFVEVRPARQPSSDTAIGVFDAAFLPTGVGVTEVRGGHVSTARRRQRRRGVGPAGPARRNKVAALKLLRKLLKKEGFAPRVIVTDKLRSHGCAMRELDLSATHMQGLRANSRAENSQQPVRRREDKMLGFKSPGPAQRYLASHAAVHNTFALQRHLASRRTLRLFRANAANAWQLATAAA